MRHPLEAIPPDRRARVFIPLLIATLLITFAFRFIGPAKPNIVDFEFAGTVGNATDIITRASASASITCTCRSTPPRSR